LRNGQSRARDEEGKMREGKNTRVHRTITCAPGHCALPLSLFLSLSLFRSFSRISLSTRFARRLHRLTVIALAHERSHRSRSKIDRHRKRERERERERKRERESISRSLFPTAALPHTGQFPPFLTLPPLPLRLGLLPFLPSLPPLPSRRFLIFLPRRLIDSDWIRVGRVVPLPRFVPNYNHRYFVSAALPVALSP